MVVYISRDVLGAIMADAIAAAPRECCGLLLSTGGSRRIDAIRRAKNVAADPLTQFEIDPRELLGAHRTQRSGGHRIIGCYHSHPGGEPQPSAVDAAQAEARGEVWIICSGDGNHAAAWIAQPGGSVHNMFEPVGLIVD